MARVYLAVPIIAKRDLSKAQFLSKTIEDMGHQIISKWVTRTDPGFKITPREVFERDIKGVKECDILVAEISNRSHGVGMEIMLAHLQGKEILCLSRKDTVISRMILGLPRAILIEYSSKNKAVKKLEEYLRKD